MKKSSATTKVINVVVCICIFKRMKKNQPVKSQSPLMAVALQDHIAREIGFIGRSGRGTVVPSARSTGKSQLTLGNMLFT